LVEALIGWSLIALGIVLLAYFFVYPLFFMALNLWPYIRYHLFGVETTVIRSLFYRGSAGRTVPSPNLLKAIAVIAFVLGIPLWVIFAY
jgi:hypothetical protein